MKKRLIFVMVAVVLAVSALAPMALAQTTPRRIEIDARRFAFSPNEITLKKGETVILVLKSDDVAHGLRVRDLNIDLKTKAGATVEVTITPDKTGDFVGHCSVFCGEGHGSMTIKVHVVA